MLLRVFFPPAKAFFILCVYVQKVSNRHIYVMNYDQIGGITSFDLVNESISSFNQLYAYLYCLLRFQVTATIHSY